MHFALKIFCILHYAFCIKKFCIMHYAFCIKKRSFFNMITVGFIGTGNMGSALARAASKADGVSVYLYDKDEAKARALAEELGCAVTGLDGILDCKVIFLAVKPNIVKDVLTEIKPRLRPTSVLVSMAAGVSLLQISLVLGKAPVIRIMPNTPAACGAGMMLYTKNDTVTDGMLEAFKSAMAHSGELDELPENLIDAASALSGCGPAFVYMFIEALADGAVACGLPRDKALAYAIETVKGSAEMVKATGEHPEALKDKVCSPGGSTIAGVHELEVGAFRAAAENAVIAAYKKTLSLGK